MDRLVFISRNCIIIHYPQTCSNIILDFLLEFSLINFWQWHQKHFLLAQILLASKPSWQFTLKQFLGSQHPQQTRYSNIVYIIPFPCISTKKEIMSIHEFPIYLRLKYVGGLEYFGLFDMYLLFWHNNPECISYIWLYIRFIAWHTLHKVMIALLT